MALNQLYLEVVRVNGGTRVSRMVACWCRGKRLTQAIVKTKNNDTDNECSGTMPELIKSKCKSELLLSG